MNKKKHQTCTVTLMDTTDPNIKFDKNGVCHYVKYYEKNIKNNLKEFNEKNLLNICKKIKQSKKGKYDCILGISGGIDSAYLLYVTKKQLGLNPLAVHIDAGWNSELAVQNIEELINKLNVDLYTHVINWEEMKDLQLAFLKSNVANQDIPQDHCFFAFLHKLALKKNIKYLITGSNNQTESILPQAWGYNAMDAKHLKSIHKKFGTIKLKTYPTISLFDYLFKCKILKKVQTVKPLNYIEYNKEKALSILKKEFNWKEYTGKHGESRFTKFFQNYYLPKKFGYDKRKAHLSSLILSNQITREQAVSELNKSTYSKNELEEDKEFISKKLNITCSALEALINENPIPHNTYPSNEKLYNFMRKIYFSLKNKKDYLNEY